jgi:formamidopyrimidine-DNA glycosylase
MPELPDLVRIVKSLAPELEGRTIVSVKVKEPIVLRVLVPGDFSSLLSGRRFSGLERHGPFLHFSLSHNEIQPVGEKELQNRSAILRNDVQPAGLDIVMHLMLAGRLRLAPASEKALPYTAFALALDDGNALSYADEKKMGKIYLCEAAQRGSIPGYETQGVDVMGDTFSYELFSRLIAKRRCQARVFVMDQGLLSAIGNAYADEILFEAGIHPKAPCYALGEEKRRALYDAVRSVLAWGISEVEASGAPLEDKVRGHMRVRGRAGERCPRCGATIRKAGVLGFDAFFCPVCQPDVTGRGLDWTKIK